MRTLPRQFTPTTNVNAPNDAAVIFLPCITDRSYIHQSEAVGRLKRLPGCSNWGGTQIPVGNTVGVKKLEKTKAVWKVGGNRYKLWMLRRSFSIFTDRFFAVQYGTSGNIVRTRAWRKTATSWSKSNKGELIWALILDKWRELNPLTWTHEKF